MRTLVLREVTVDSFVIFINGTSPKWRQLQDSKQFELLVFWPTLMQQYRIRGDCSEVAVEAMKAHWASKPYESKIIDHYYAEHQPQTSALDSRETLLAGVNALKERYPVDADIPFPENAKGVAVKASYIEVWRGSDVDRLHERHLYLLSGNTWETRVLVP